MREKEYSEWMSKQGFDVLRHANCCKIAFNGGWESQQSKVDELQKRVDDLTELNRLKTIALQQSVNRTSPYVHEKIVALEQALKGEQ